MPYRYKLLTVCKRYQKGVDKQNLCVIIITQQSDLRGIGNEKHTY